MKNIIKSTLIFLMLLLMTRYCSAQLYSNSYRTTDAVMVKINERSQTEGRLSGVTVALFTNLHLLNVRLNTAFSSANDSPGINSMLDPGLTFDLKVKVDPSLILESLTSAKLFATHGSLTINSITRPVTVQYVPLPAGTETNGAFNISMIIEFDPGDFNPTENYNNSRFIIKINDATVNRV